MDDSVFMIRDAIFGRDFTPKLATALLGLALVLWDSVRHKRLDYVWVFVFGTVIWGGAEAFLQIQGIRDMPNRTLFDAPIALPGSYVLQGMSEGAFVAVIGIFIGDRLLVRSSRWKAAVGLLGVVLLIASSTVRTVLRTEGLGEVASRRDILAPTALGLIAVTVVISAVFVWRWVAWRPRTLAMFSVMVVVGTVWTVAQVSLGGRWVEVGSTASGFQDAGPLVSLLAFAFDVVMEIAIPYVPFLALPVMVGLIRNPAPLPTVEQVSLPAQAPPAAPVHEPR